MKHLVLSWLLLLSWSAFAQKPTTSQPFNLGEYAPLTVSYYGNFATHPGLKLGFDWNLFLLEKTKTKKRKTKTLRKLLTVTPSLAFYHHRASHTGLLLATDLSWRRYGRSLFYKEVGIGLGYFRKFNVGETWEVKEDGSVTNMGSTSRGYFTPALFFGLGKRFTVLDDTPMAAFLKLNINTPSGYNATTVAELNIELGFRMALNGGIKRGAVKTLTKP